MLTQSSFTFSKHASGHNWKLNVSFVSLSV
uniref:Uncharacterized protein n=1 Tax=Rhizophora mucronata TaxID=61149 RepID=A0A2P2NSR8_RHIMU